MLRALHPLRCRLPCYTPPSYVHAARSGDGAPQGFPRALSNDRLVTTAHDPDLTNVPPENGAAPHDQKGNGTGVATLPSPEATEPSVAKPMIVFEEVTKVYEPGVVAIEDISLTIDKSEFVFLVGPSGSGKSTMVRLLIKEIEPTGGRIIMGGRELGRLKRKLVPMLRRNVGCVFQDFKLLPNRTSFENVAYALRVQGQGSAEIRQKVPEVLALVGLTHKMSSYPDELSGGEQQRVSIARAFVNQPPILICDEPTGNLDPDTSVGIMQLLYRINRTGTTIVMATHDREMVDKMRRRVIALEDGHLIRDERRGGYGS
jgi:cell division transport system ATP-binding protein